MGGGMDLLEAANAAPIAVEHVEMEEIDTSVPPETWGTLNETQQNDLIEKIKDVKFVQYGSPTPEFETLLVEKFKIKKEIHEHLIGFLIFAAANKANSSKVDNFT